MRHFSSDAISHLAKPPAERPLLIFSHGNSFPASTYSVMLVELSRLGYEVRALERLGHDPRYPVTQNWPHLVTQLAEFIAQQAGLHQGPVFLAGHSLGGFLSLMTACQHPVLGGKTMGGVVLMDSPLVGGWRAKLLKFAQTTRLAGRFPPGAISRQRRNRWISQEEVLGHYSSKASFAKWHPQVLQDYITYGTHDENGERVLSFTREVETAIYNCLPHHVETLLQKHPPRFPVSFIGGEQSLELRQAGLALTRQVVGRRLTMLPGSHLFPMESPLETAAAVDAALRDLAAAPPISSLTSEALGVTA
ncbi:MAG: alpha/beta hydrolase [Burkholderiaceae bacterium]